MTPAEVSQVLFAITTNEQEALSRGLRDRQRISEALGRGETPMGHRVDWLHKTAQALNATLMEAARQFNTKHPGDQISVHDLVDALATLQNHLIKTCRDMDLSNKS